MLDEVVTTVVAGKKWRSDGGEALRSSAALWLQLARGGERRVLQQRIVERRPRGWMNGSAGMGKSSERAWVSSPKACAGRPWINRPSVGWNRSFGLWMFRWEQYYGQATSQSRVGRAVLQ